MKQPSLRIQQISTYTQRRKRETFNLTPCPDIKDTTES